MKTIHLIAAARPNFMKVAPLWHALRAEHGWARPVIVHTGQHYDPSMSGAFFTDLRMKEPDHNLGIGSGSHAEQTGGVMIAYEKLCMTQRPDWVVVVGDVNSTIACTLSAKKLGLPVAHLEAGLRSRDRTMPEELNRLLTDAIADLLWTPSPDADANLRAEGVPEERIEFVGNIMIDSLELVRPLVERERVLEEMSLAPGSYGIVTLHRPANVDDPVALKGLVGAIAAVADRLPLVFPVHPRTRARLTSAGLVAPKSLRLVEPMGYIRFMTLLRGAKLAITDSGGLQEETTYLGIPCLTLRDTTERPVTISEGTNRLVRIATLGQDVDDALSGDWPTGRHPALWDGKTAGRIVKSLRKACNG
jgi:UDP-N-acetylglucosamine 2-epimerase (non-hydrolysing)